MRRLASVAIAGLLLAARGAAAQEAGDPEAKADFQRRGPEAEPQLSKALGGDVSVGAYGYLRLDYAHDSTQGLTLLPDDRRIQSPGTYRGDHGEHLVGLNGRLGLTIGNPRANRYGWMALLELGRRRYDDAPIAPRIAFLAGRTPIVDVLVGRYHDLFGWGGRAFFPATVAFLGLPGQIYSQRAQVRISHVFRWNPVDLEIAGAVPRPVSDNLNSVELQLGIRLAVNGRIGASEQAASAAAAAPLQIGLSFVGRRFTVPAFTADTTRPRESVDGVGIALNAFLPLIAARPDGDLANALSLNFEASTGRGIADLYSGFTGGARFPLLPNPTQSQPAPQYGPGIPQGLVTFDATADLHAIEWRAFVIGARYHLPFARGRRVWVTANLSRMASGNLKELTPPPSWGGLVVETRYADASVIAMVWRGLQLAASFQVTRQTTAAPLFTGDGENRRFQAVVAYAF